MMRLFQTVCQPLASADTRGAFLFGHWLIAIDGTLDDMADTWITIAEHQIGL